MMLSREATLAEVAEHLNKPVEFLRRVSEHMWACKREFGTASLQLGVTGQGRAPNYRIEYTEGESERVFATYNGLSHKEVEDLGETIFSYPEGYTPDPNAPQKVDWESLIISGPDRSFVREHWSSRVLGFDEFLALFRKLWQRRVREW